MSNSIIKLTLFIAILMNGVSCVSDSRRVFANKPVKAIEIPRGFALMDSESEYSDLSLILRDSKENVISITAYWRDNKSAERALQVLKQDVFSTKNNNPKRMVDTKIINDLEWKITREKDASQLYKSYMYIDDDKWILVVLDIAQVIERDWSSFVESIELAEKKKGS